MDRTTSVEMPAVHKQLTELYERVKFSLVLQPLSVALYASDRKLGGRDLGIKLGSLVS